MRNTLTRLLIPVGLIVAWTAAPFVRGQVTIPNTFVNGTTADADQVDTNFTQLGNQALNRTGGTMTGTLTSQTVTPALDNTYALGDGSHAFSNLYTKGTTQFNGRTYTWPASETAQYVLQTNGSGTLTWVSALTANLCQVRLTATSATPVTSGDVTGATSLFVTPYLGNYCAFYNGSSWVLDSISEVTIALGTLTSGLPYDVFCSDNAGAMACDAPLAWTNTTTRATAIAFQNGVPVRTGATGHRFIGTFFTTSTTATEDSAAKRFVANYYNRVPRDLYHTLSGGPYAYTTSAWRQTNADAANQVEFVTAVVEHEVLGTMTLSAAATAGGAVGIGITLDGTGAPTGYGGAIGGTGAANYTTGSAYYRGYPAVGYHKLVAVENGFGVAAVNFAGTAALQAGLFMAISGTVWQ